MPQTKSSWLKWGSRYKLESGAESFSNKISVYSYKIISIRQNINFKFILIKRLFNYKQVFNFALFLFKWIKEKL